MEEKAVYKTLNGKYFPLRWNGFAALCDGLICDDCFLQVKSTNPFNCLSPNVAKLRLLLVDLVRENEELKAQLSQAQEVNRLALEIEPKTVDELTVFKKVLVVERIRELNKSRWGIREQAIIAELQTLFNVTEEDLKGEGK